MAGTSESNSSPPAVKKDSNSNSPSKRKSRSPARSPSPNTTLKRRSPSPAAVNGNKSLKCGSPSPTGALNKLAGLMPPGSFILISTTFHSISDAHRNLLSTFNEPSISSETPLRSSEQCKHSLDVVSSTKDSQTHVSFIAADSQTDSVHVQTEAKDAQTEVYFINEESQTE